MSRPDPTHPTGSGAASPEAIPVFLSYSHDSSEHERRVFELADRLRADGIDCELDQFEESPPEGWPAWMTRQIREARYVLVVCTATYRLRVTGCEKEGVGLGARWEGGLTTQSLYESGGRNDKFIPLVFGSESLQEIPEFLRHTTHYDLSDPAAYERLYRRLTTQPRVLKRPLGQRRTLPPEVPDVAARWGGGEPSGHGEAEPGRQANTEGGGAGTRGEESGHAAPSVNPTSAPALALIRESSGRSHFVPLLSVKVGDTITAVVRPEAGTERVYLESLTGSRYNSPTVNFAFGLTAVLARLTSVTRSFDGGEDRYTLLLTPEHSGRAGAFMEMATTGYSADDIAALRARRILLDERLSTSDSRTSGRWGKDSTLESLVRGYDSEFPVECSPLPELFRATEEHGDARFIAAARLTAVLWLQLTGTVAHVHELDMRVQAPGALAVRFRGERARIYTNKDPEVILAEGICPLR